MYSFVKNFNVMEIKSSNNSKSVHDGKESYTLREEYDNGESAGG